MITVNFTGRLGGNPELKYTPSGKAVCALSVAHTDRRKDGDKWVDGDTTWLRVVLWEKAAEAAQSNFGKGDLVIVSGRLTVREYEAEGAKRTSVEILSATVGLVSRPAARTSTAPKDDDLWTYQEPPF